MRVVDTLNPVVRQLAGFLVLAIVGLVEVTQIVPIQVTDIIRREDLGVVQHSSLVLHRVIVPTVLVVVLLALSQILALLNFEFAKVKVLHEDMVALDVLGGGLVGGFEFLTCLFDDAILKSNRDVGRLELVKDFFSLHVLGVLVLPALRHLVCG